MTPAPQQNPQPLAGRRALVTGGASGIGRAIAVAFADAGAGVTILDRDVAAKAVAHEIGALAVVADLSDLDAIADLDLDVDIVGALPHMYQQGWGRIVNVSSVHGLRASAYKGAYVSAKHGLEGLSKVAALEGAQHGVTSNCINPAYVRTALLEAQIADQAHAHGISESEVLEQIMLAPAAVKRLIEPEEVAALALFLCGKNADSVTGSSFCLDGGWTAH
jgi:3-hydroxybutyrate dehydrogenase